MKLTEPQQRALKEIKQQFDINWFKPLLLYHVVHPEATCYKLRDRGYLEWRIEKDKFGSWYSEFRLKSDV